MSIQLLSLGFLAVVSMLLFFPLNTRKGYLRESSLVQHIPFVPAFIVPYLGLFPYIAFSMLALLFFTPVAARLYVSLIFSALVAAIIWYFIPTGVSERPEFIPKGPFTKMTAWMYSLDPRCNAFPSSHTYTAIVCSYYLMFAFPLHEVLIFTCGTTIVSSTLFIKQHHLSDLIAGATLAAISIVFSYFILGGLA
jgi:membrane-associated phospholipid phosphatase